MRESLTIKLLPYETTPNYRRDIYDLDLEKKIKKEKKSERRKLDKAYRKSN